MAAAAAEWASSTASFEGVDKSHTLYRFHESTRAGEERFDDDFEIAEVDMTAEDFSAQLGAALQDIGFAVLTNTGVPHELLARCEAAVPPLFEGLPLGQKRRFLARRPAGKSVNAGYFPQKQTAGGVSDDLVEGWVFPREAFDVPQRDDNDGGGGGGGGDDDAAPAAATAPAPPAPPAPPSSYWPSEHAAGRHAAAVFREYLLAMEPLVAPIARALLEHLGDADPRRYDRALSPCCCALRLNYYGAISDEDDATGAGRLLGHEDVTLFTLLPAPSVEGLQVRTATRYLLATSAFSFFY